MENAVEKAIRLLGPSMWEAAIRTRIHPTTLYKWAKAGRIKDGRRAVEVSRLTEGQVTIEELVGASPNGQPNGTERVKKGKTSARSRALALPRKSRPALHAPPAALAA
jgi:DNA-binding transcriptional regulator YdaS (Cro superfamily)